MTAYNDFGSTDFSTKHGDFPHLTCTEVMGAELVHSQQLMMP